MPNKLPARFQLYATSFSRFSINREASWPKGDERQGIEHEEEGEQPERHHPVRNGAGVIEPHGGLLGGGVEEHEIQVEEPEQTVAGDYLQGEQRNRQWCAQVSGLTV